MASDLNIILDPKEKQGGIIGKDPFQEMVDSLIHAHDLLDLNPKKGNFTWTNNRLSLAQIFACLDRFLVQSSLLDFDVLSSSILPKLTSDHHPIALLLEREENIGPLPFVSILFGLKGTVLGN